MSSVTRILAEMESGDPAAAERLLPLVYQELRKLAAVKLSREKSAQTLQPTVLVHEAYLRLVDAPEAQAWNGRGHFFAAAAEAMRRILIENARRKQSRRHGGGRRRLDLDTVNPGTKPRDEELLALDEESQPGEYTHAVSLAVLALARHQRQQPEAQAALEEASQLITRLHEDPSTKGHHDLVIAEILVREAKTLINGVAD